MNTNATPPSSRRRACCSRSSCAPPANSPAPSPPGRCCAWRRAAMATRCWCCRASAASDTSTKTAASLPRRPRLRRARLGSRPQHGPATRRARGPARPARRAACVERPAHQPGRLEPRWRVCARARAASAGRGSQRRDARQPVRRRCARDARAPRLRMGERAAHRRAGPRSCGAAPATCRRPRSSAAATASSRGAPACKPEGPLAENVEVVGSHIGLGVHAPVLYAVADRLAQPEGGWKPFDPPWTLRALYPDPRRTAHPDAEPMGRPGHAGRWRPRRVAASARRIPATVAQANTSDT